MLQRQIVATDRQIDRPVYELYGVTTEEVGIVEAGGWALRAKTPKVSETFGV